MQGSRLPRQVRAFSGGPKECSASVQKIVLEGPETRKGGCQAEAEQAQSAGRRLRPDAVSGRRKGMGRREKIHGAPGNRTLGVLSVKPQSCVEYAERFAYWTMSESSPHNMAAMMVTCCMTSAGKTRAIGWAASISSCRGTRIMSSSQRVSSFDWSRLRNSA
jgi:hypothetical protein